MNLRANKSWNIGQHDVKKKSFLTELKKKPTCQRCLPKLWNLEGAPEGFFSVMCSTMNRFLTNVSLSRFFVCVSQSEKCWYQNLTVSLSLVFFFFTVPSVYVLKPVPALLNKESSSHEVVLVVLWSNNSLIRTPFFTWEMRSCVYSRFFMLAHVGLPPSRCNESFSQNTTLCVVVFFKLNFSFLALCSVLW